MPIRKFTQLTFMAAALAALFFAAAVAKPASADITALTASNASPALNTPITISGQITTQGPATLAVSATLPAFQSGGLSTGEQASGTGSSQLAIQIGSAGPRTMTLIYSCTTAGTSTISATQTGAPAQTITVNCGAGATTAPVVPNATGALIINPPSGTASTVTGNCAAGDQLTVAGQAYFTGVTLNGTAIAAATGSSTATCATAGTISASVICTAFGTANFALGSARGTMSCTAAGASVCGATVSPTGIPLNQSACTTAQTGPVSSATTLTVSAAPSTVGCTGTSAVTTLTITVSGANGAMIADKTPVTVTANAGVVSAPSLQTLSGKAQTPYTAPSTPPAGGSVTITATAAGATGSTNVALSCAGGSTVPSTSAPPPVTGGLPPAPPPPPVATGDASGSVFRPPNTGDAGLKALEVE